MKTEITLQYPIEANGTTRKTVALRRPKVRDFEVVNAIKDEFEQAVRLIANLSEMTPDEVREIDMADYKKIQEIISGFLGQNA